MVPPPPSQAGRFKPRPAKTIRPPGAADGESGRPLSRGSGRGSGRGGDRGGRASGGRGRGGRFQLPQGQAFFGNNNATATAGRKLQSTAGQRPGERGSASRNATMFGRGIKRQQGTDATSGEEIVGMLEEGIGSSAVPASVVSSSSDIKKSDAANRAFERALLGEEHLGTNLKFSTVGGDLYDSDSSGEEVPKSLSRKECHKQPISLPFNVQRISTQIAGDERPPINYESRGLESLTRPKNTSPFVHPYDTEGVELEKNNLFLVQLPSRLPPLKRAQSALDGGDTTELSGEELSPVATPSLQSSAFDNTLSTAIPGKLGKIKVYKSGKTVLILESADGEAAIEMIVSEGLTCGFKQLAVSIDLDTGVFIPLGNVEKTIVVTPNLSRLESRS